MKRIMILLSACGAATNAQEQTDVNGVTEANASGTQQVATPNTAGQDTGDTQSLVAVRIKDDTHADFVFYGDGQEPLSDVTVFAVSFGGYKVVLNDYDRTGEFQCGV